MMEGRELDQILKQWAETVNLTFAEAASIRESSKQSRAIQGIPTKQWWKSLFKTPSLAK